VLFEQRRHRLCRQVALAIHFGDHLVRGCQDIFCFIRGMKTKQRTVLHEHTEHGDVLNHLLACHLHEIGHQLARVREVLIGATGILRLRVGIAAELVEGVRGRTHAHHDRILRDLMGAIVGF
jgi:hypothetical protein